jgi:hypothetical protein
MQEGNLNNLVLDTIIIDILFAPIN